MKLSAFAFTAIFTLSFVCFLLGWLFAVFILPGQKLQHLAEVKHSKQLSSKDSAKTQDQNQLFLEEIKNNILLLFDPYKMDILVKKDTKLEQESSFIKKPDPVSVKKNINPYSLIPRTNLKIIEEKKEHSALAEPAPQESNSKLHSIQADYDKKNKSQLILIEEEQRFFKSNGKFSFMVNVFSDQQKAFNYINQMKKQYPMWSFLLKAQKDHVRVYLGPFSSKELAVEFKKSIPKPSPFSSLDFLEEVSL